MRLKKRFLAAAGGVALVLAVTATAVSALSSIDFNLDSNSMRGGNTGGGVLTSDDFTLVTGFGGLVSTELSGGDF